MPKKNYAQSRAARRRAHTQIAQQTHEAAAENMIKQYHQKQALQMLLSEKLRLQKEREEALASINDAKVRIANLEKQRQEALEKIERDLQETRRQKHVKYRELADEQVNINKQWCYFAARTQDGLQVQMERRMRCFANKAGNGTPCTGCIDLVDALLTSTIPFTMLHHAMPEDICSITLPHCHLKMWQEKGLIEVTDSTTGELKTMLDPANPDECWGEAVKYITELYIRFLKKDN